MDKSERWHQTMNAALTGLLASGECDSRSAVKAAFQMANMAEKRLAEVAIEAEAEAVIK